MRRKVQDHIYCWLLVGIIAVLGLTTRKVWINRSYLEALQEEGQNFILGIWHNSIIFLIFPLRALRLTVLASRSRDGQNIARVAEAFGIQSVAGSTSDGAFAGIREMIRLLRDGRNVTIMPDGPRGPRYVLKDGAIALARRNNVPIIPVAFAGRKMFEFSSWDRMKLPHPFSKVAIYVGNPIWIGRDEQDETALRLKVEQAMREAVLYADRFVEGGLTEREPLLAELLKT